MHHNWCALNMNKAATYYILPADYAHRLYIPLHIIYAIPPPLAHCDSRALYLDSNRTVDDSHGTTISLPGHGHAWLYRNT